MFGGYEDIEAFEDYLYREESSSETSFDSELEFHLYSQVHYAQDLEDVNDQEETEEAGFLEKQDSVSKQDEKNNFVVISDSDDIHFSDSSDVVILSDTPDEDSVYKSKAQKPTALESSVLGRTYNLTESNLPKLATGSSKESAAKTSRKKRRTNQQSVSFHRDGVRVIHKILVIEDSSSGENADDVASLVSDSDKVESWMLLGGAQEDKDENILLNLEGCGTSASEGEGGEGWTISDKDLEAQIGNHATIRHNNRYYMPQKNVTCRNCNKYGHLSKNCPSPKKIPPCCLCARRGHLQNTCPARFCLNCSLPGHFSRECIERSYWSKYCRRCDMRGHHEDACPEIWRQYHLTTKQGSLKKASSYSKHSSLIYCYNCAKKGHYGYECTEQRMFRGTFPTSPFIYYYDREYDVKRGDQRAKRKVQELQESGLLLMDLKKPYRDDSQKEHSHRRKRKMSKEHENRKETLHMSFKKKSPADQLKGRKLKKVLQNNDCTKKYFGKSGNMHTLKRSKKSRAQHEFVLPTNGGKPEIHQASLKALKKRKKRQRSHRNNNPTIDENLFLIKQKRKKSKHKPDC